MTKGTEGIDTRDTNQNRQILIRVTSQRGPIDPSLLAFHMPGETLEHERVRFTVDDEPADIVVVLNYVKYDTKLRARDGFVFLWHNEPIVRRPFPKGFDRVYTHIDDSNDPRVRPAPPILDWWIEKSFDELDAMVMPPKPKQCSAIASTKEMIEGHRVRNDFISRVENEVPGLEIFGKGRKNGLRDKWDGLAPYKYSIAIENTSKPHYWTEKIADCFLAGTVPLYFGATNIAEYFPPESFIWLPIDKPETAVRVLHDTLSKDDWSARNTAVLEARRRVLHEYSLFSQLVRIANENMGRIPQAPWRTYRVHGRRISRGGWIRGLSLAENLESLKARRATRRENSA